MKRKLKNTLLITLAILICALSFINVTADTIYVYNGFSYTLLNGDYISICGWDNSSDDFIVPAQLDGSYVKEIANMGMRNNTFITSLDMGSAYYMTRIGDMAFKGCSNLTGTISVPARITEVGIGAFQGCSSITTANYYASTSNVPTQCFYQCSSLKSASISNGVTSIEKFAFADCISLSEIRIPASVESINPTAFNGCNNLVIYCYTDSYAHQFAEDNGIDYVLLDAPAKEYFVGRSLSLDGDIGVNFYLDLTADEAKNAVVNFSWNVNNEVKTSSFNLSNAKRLTAGYKATCRIAPAEMTGSILAELLINDKKVGEERYSAKQYADVILSDSYKAAYKGTGARSYDNLKNLILNMLSFGSRAQTAFAVNLDTLADKDSGYTPEPVRAEDIPVTDANMTEGLDNYGLSYVGSTLVCLTETTIRHYYKVTDQNKFDAVKNNIFIEGKPASAVEKNGSIYFEINNIPAADLDRDYTLKIGNNEYQYSAFNYIKTALPSNKVEDNVKKLIQVLYRYNQAANAFFA